MIRCALLLALALLGSGCSWINSFLGGTDNSPPPAELVSIQAPIAIEKLWETRVGSGTEGAFVTLVPAVDRGRVYAASFDGVVAAVDAASGKESWRVKTKLPISAGVAVGDGLVLMGTSNGEVLALHEEDGKEAWRAQVSSEILAVPQAAEGVVVVRTVDGKFNGLDTRSGTRLWLYEHSVPVLSLRGSAAPLLAQGVAITGLDTGTLLALSLRDGTPVFERTIAPPRGRTELERMVDIDSEPKVVGSTLFVGAYQGNITAIDLKDGKTLWSRDISTYAGLDADTRRVYVSDASDNVWALDESSGNSLWKQTELTGRELSAPIVTGDYVVVGDFEGYLHWLDARDGKVVGRVRVDKKGIATVPVVQGDTLFAYGKGGTLSAYRLGAG